MGSKLSDDTDTLKIPIVLGKYHALRKALAYKNIFSGDNLTDVIKDYRTHKSGITSMSYEVSFETANIICLKLYYETMGAYPDSYEQWMTLEVETGKRHPISKEISPKGLKWLYKSYRDTLRKRLNAKNNEYKKDPDLDGVDVYSRVKDGIDDLTANDLFQKFIFTDEGMVLSVDRMLPHFIAGKEPNLDLLIPYKKLKPYIASHAIVLKQYR